ncbi:MAG: replicative DNA helicase, partial [Planctomycetota bacterium]
FDRLPPHDAEAEAALLGAMLIDPSVTDEVIQHVPSGDSFYLAAHATIFDALYELHEHRRAGDLVLLKEKLEGKDQLDEVGGVSYLARIVEETPSAAAAVHYARVVRDKARLRGLITAAEQTLYDAYHAGELGEDGVQHVLDESEQRIFKITEQAGESDEASVADIARELMEALERNRGRTVTGVATGFMDLDELTTGLQPGELIIVAARPSMGKTALALNLAEQIARGGSPYAGHDPRTPIGFFSLEMSRQSIVQRFLTSTARVDAQKMRRNMLSEQDRNLLEDAAYQLAGLPIILDDTPGLTVMQMKARARRMVARHGVKCLVVDYLQLMSAPHVSRDGRQNEVSEISRQIKSLARELKLPIICLAQLNRASEQREGHRPRMADLRESGSIEQDADVIMLLHREEYYHVQDTNWASENQDKVGVAELIVAKQRNGPTDVVKLSWIASSTRFASHTRYRDDVPQHQPAAHEPVVHEPVVKKVGFAPGAKAGPVEDHRDGGGSDRGQNAGAFGDDVDVPF